MGVVEIFACMLLRRKPEYGSIWDYLGKRSADKSRVELEKTRNDGTQRLVSLLKPGMVLTEGGPDWHREIRMPGVTSPATLLTTVTPEPPAPPPVADELQPALQNELILPPKDQAGRLDLPGNADLYWHVSHDAMNRFLSGFRRKSRLTASSRKQDIGDCNTNEFLDPAGSRNWVAEAERGSA